MRRQPRIPDLPQRGSGPLVFGLVIFAAGLSLVALAVVKAIPISRARVLLERVSPHRVQGSLSFVVAGVPIFWRTLDGLHRLERQDYTRGDIGTGRRHKHVGDMTITRVGFVDSQGRTLAWAERASVFNASGRVEDFLGGREPMFIFMEDISPLGMASGFTAATTALFAAVLFTVGALCVIGGLRCLVGVLFWKDGNAMNLETPSNSGPG